MLDIIPSAGDYQARLERRTKHVDTLIGILKDADSNSAASTKLAFGKFDPEQAIKSDE